MQGPLSKRLCTRRNFRGPDASGSDPYWSYVTLLLSGNGSNGSTTIGNSATGGGAVTCNGNAQISTAQSKWGGSSIYLDGSGDYLSLAAASAFAFGTGDFTVELWVKLTSAGSFSQLIGTHNVFALTDGAWRIGERFNSADNLYFTYEDTGFHDLTTTTDAVSDAWRHVAACRVAGVLKLFVDGVQVLSQAMTANLSHTGSLLIGYNPRDVAYTTGYLQDIRITKGVARYTGNFTPPAAAHPTF